MLQAIWKRLVGNRPERRRSARLAAVVETVEGRQMLSAAPAASLLVPAYFYPVPGGDWDRMAVAARSAPVTAILNPDSGPGAKADPVYAAAVNKLRAAGGRVVGYVHTTYGQRPLASVGADVRAYVAFYHIDGIFVDEVATDATHVSYYQKLYSFTKKLNAGYQVIANPGTNTSEAYLTAPTADVLVDFEDNQPAYNGMPPSSWVRKYAASHFATILGRATTTNTMTIDLSWARQRNAGYVYVTDQDVNDDNTAYTRLPSYWTSEIAAVHAENGG